MIQVLLFCGAFLTGIAQAGEIFKCEVDGQVRYVQSRLACGNRPDSAHTVKADIEDRIANKQEDDHLLIEAESWLKGYDARQAQTWQKSERYQKTYEKWIKTDRKAQQAQAKADEHQQTRERCLRKTRKKPKACRLNKKLQKKADRLKEQAAGYQAQLSQI